MLLFEFNCRERDLLLVPYSNDRDLDITQWPPFLLASMVNCTTLCPKIYTKDYRITINQNNNTVCGYVHNFIHRSDSFFHVV
jgi:hypothetical protein